MMMTCRLLCALLVLALCCCPSVCMTASDVNQVSDPGPGSSPKGTSEKGGKGQALSSAGAAGLPGSGPVSDPQKSTGGASPRPTTEQEQGEAVGPGPSSASPMPSAKDETGKLNGIDGVAASQGISVAASTNLEHPNTEGQRPIRNDGPGDTGSQEAQSDNTAVTNQTDTIVDDSAETTTNTTNTTTTTTTTTAPEAPSTTTTEGPTTTTTGAPSRLPEIDGSLSSSAWVCAPLLLAVSALAYTTLG
ncbi:mucin TcMUCII, putative [Trypanosoma cruzi marinkellei]|uniref:Mucin TcMUCII, putative n=1 Tax=Trypanosoma cruzi marinkellei TaxID=85056 RepID=K2MQ49_TRYCR|nr:mucin TcMUCII, putative [Trypanosoma cruzi marinkellei]